MDYESSPTTSSKLFTGKSNLLKKELELKTDFTEVLKKSSATNYERYMICRAAGLCVPGVFPFMNIRSTSKQYQQVRKFCLTDTSSLLQIIQSSPNRLSDTDERKSILADTFVGIEGLGDFRGKELHPNAFMTIEVIQTENPNYVKLVLIGSEATAD